VEGVQIGDIGGDIEAHRIGVGTCSGGGIKVIGSDKGAAAAECNQCYGDSAGQ
jgi:hypothetical protein